MPLNVNSVSTLKAIMQEGCEKLETFCCVFCREQITLPLADFDNFKNHMETVHNVFYQFDLLLACNFLDKEDQAEMMERVKRKWKIMSKESEDSNKKPNEADEFRNKMAGYKTSNENRKVSIKQTSPKTFISSVEKESVIKISNSVEAKLVDPKLHGCNTCDYRTKYKTNLNVHIEAKHEGVKYKCIQCDYTGTKYGLKDHGRAKHGGKLYVCELCDYATSYVSALSSHKKAQHEGVTYQCDLCDNKFKWRIGLKTHRETKHDKQLYECDQCEYKISKPRNLSLHIKSKHEKVKFECKQCNKKVFHLKEHVKRYHSKSPQIWSGCELSVI